MTPRANANAGLSVLTWSTDRHIRALVTGSVRRASPSARRGRPRSPGHRTTHPSHRTPGRARQSSFPCRGVGGVVVEVESSDGFQDEGSQSRATHFVSGLDGGLGVGPVGVPEIPVEATAVDLLAYPGQGHQEPLIGAQAGPVGVPQSLEDRPCTGRSHPHMLPDAARGDPPANGTSVHRERSSVGLVLKDPDRSSRVVGYGWIC
jgi:hypothetical protein